MLGKMKCKMVCMSIIIALVAGTATGASFWLLNNSKCFCKKAIKAFKEV